jgi:hypothetical protein
LPEQELVRKTSKRRKTQHIVQKTSPTHHTHQNNDSNAHNIRNPMQELSHEYPDLDDPHQHTKSINTLSKPYPIETTHPSPKPYKLRPNRVQKAPNIRKRKKHPHYPQHENQHQLESYKQTQPTIIHSSVAQAPPRINMAFLAPSIMPHRNPHMNTSKYKQTTLEH